MIPVIVRWFSSDGGDQSLPISLPALPPVGGSLDLSGIAADKLEFLGEDEQRDLEDLRVLDVKIRAVAANSPDFVAEIMVERAAETEHRRELEAKDAALVHVACTTSHLLNLLTLVLRNSQPARAFFELEGGEDKRDLVAVHVAEGYRLSADVVEAVDAIFVYPTADAARKRDTSRRCIKHRFAELVTKGGR